MVDDGTPQEKHTLEQIVAKFRQVDVLVWQGRSVAEAVRSIGVMQFAYNIGGRTSGPEEEPGEAAEGT